METKKRTLWKNHKCISYRQYCWENCINHLDLNPLTIAKYFWEKGIDDYALIQDFLYLTYTEALWKKLLLFEERFQAWEEGPVIESVYQKMRNHYKKYEKLDNLFSKVKDVEERKVKSYLAKVYRDYQKSKKEGKEIDFIFQVQDAPWEAIREDLDSGKSSLDFMEGEKVFLSLANRVNG